MGNFFRACRSWQERGTFDSWLAHRCLIQFTAQVIFRRSCCTDLKIRISWFSIPDSLYSSRKSTKLPALHLVKYKPKFQQGIKGVERWNPHQFPVRLNVLKPDSRWSVNFKVAAFHLLLDLYASYLNLPTGMHLVLGGLPVQTEYQYLSSIWYE